MLANVDNSNIEKILEALSSAYPTYNGIGALRPDLLGEYLLDAKINTKLMDVYFRWLAEIIREQGARMDRKNNLIYLANAQATAKRLQGWQKESKVTNYIEDAFSNLPSEDSLSIAAADMFGDTRLRGTSLWASKKATENPRNTQLQQANALSSYSVDLKNMGELEDSILIVEEAIELFNDLVKKTAIHDPQWSYLQLSIADCCLNASSRYYDLHRRGNLDAISKSEKLARDVAHFFQINFNQSSDPYLQEKLIGALRALSAALQGLKKYGPALRTARKAHELALFLDTPIRFAQSALLSDTHASLAQRYRAFHAYDLAELNFRKSIQLRRSLHNFNSHINQYRISITLLNLACTLEDQCKSAQALIEAEESLKIRLELFELNPTAHAADVAEIQEIVNALKTNEA